jgi:PhoH-like ATPase
MSPHTRSSASRKKTDKPGKEKRIFILDTNVLMHDPTALFRFEEHDLCIPIVVLEELDQAKKGMSEVSRNARQASRFLNALVEDANSQSIQEGFPIKATDYLLSTRHQASGRLFFPVSPPDTPIPGDVPLSKVDNQIISIALTLTQKYPKTSVKIVSKDINLRIKATILGIRAEDYQNDKVLDDVDLLFAGYTALPGNFWDKHAKNLESWKEEGRSFYRVEGKDLSHWYPNQFVFLDGDAPLDAIVRRVENKHATLELIHDFTNPRHKVWGINARNREQNYALNLLMDPDIDFVTLMGMAGTGKTLLALAAGLSQVLDDKRYSEIIMTRVTIPVGEDIGFLPGTEEEKMTPWMGALMDNLDVLTQNGSSDEWGRAATQDLLKNRIKIRSLNFMRGRTFQNKFLIIDEAQNLTPKQMKTLVTRSGPGTKVVCMGNVSQIDTPYLTETTSGMTFIVDRFKDWPYSGHVTLKRGERSRLADYASEIL